MEEYLNEFKECEPVQLEPFIHQVGGHSSILCLDERTVCKPLIKQELQFYESLPTSMKKFTPEYRGVVQVRFEEDKDGYLTVAAYPPKSFRYQPSQSKKRNNSRRIRVKNSGSIEIEIESELNDLFVEEEPVPVSQAGTSTSTSQKGQGVKSLNPWVLKCHQRQLSKLKRSATVPQQKEPLCQKFLLLENITWRFEYPCILDLKMGQRQWGDDATPQKIASQSVKAANSTSVQLGVRICGMQVYQQSSGKFLCRNKYYGRKLSVEGFKEAICQFLHNGKRLRTDAILPLIEKLKDLKTALTNLDTYRFYTSSLLLAYEGLDPDYCGEDDSSASMDSEMTESSIDSDSINAMGHAGGGGINLIHNFSEIKGPSSFLGMIPASKSADEISLSLKRGNSLDDGEYALKNPKIGDSSCSSFSLETVTEPACDGMGMMSQSQSNSTNISNVATRGSSTTTSTSSLSLESVDVRMIDFAHATHSGLDCGKEHTGPDTGYIFGLNNLINVLQEVVTETCSF